MLYDQDQDEISGVWNDGVAELDGQTCEFCGARIALMQAIAVTDDHRVMHKNCFEDQPTRVIARIKSA